MTQNTIAIRKKTDKCGDINITVVDIENKLIVTKGDRVGGDGGSYIRSLGLTYTHYYIWASLVAEEPASQCRSRRRHGFDPWVGKIPWRGKWQPTPVFLLG